MEVNHAAVKEMHRQVGDLMIDPSGITRRGLLVRHLVLPENVSGTDSVLTFLANDVSIETYVNLMDQYRPCYRADENPPLRRSIRSDEYARALACAQDLGLHRFG